MDQPPSDESLLGNFLKGERSALEALARRYEGPLLGLAAALLDGRTDMAADAIQETWLRVIRFGHQFNAKSSFKTWLYRIAINQCKTTKSRAQAVDVGPRAIDVGSATSMLHPSSSLTDPASGDDASHLRESLRHLTPDRRIVILLCYHRAMTHEQAAAILGLPLGTLKTRLRAAMTELRADLLGRSALRADAATEQTP
jgi:RNA polymerase sigma-70 factor, ECF subfamily